MTEEIYINTITCPDPEHQQIGSYWTWYGLGIGNEYGIEPIEPIETNETIVVPFSSYWEGNHSV